MLFFANFTSLIHKLLLMMSSFPTHGDIYWPQISDYTLKYHHLLYYEAVSYQ